MYKSESNAWEKSGSAASLDGGRQFSHFRVVNGVFYDQGGNRLNDDQMKRHIVDAL